MSAAPRGRVLIIAGSDSGGGAGIQGDLKTVTCLGGYAATAITALTAQNTLGVHAIYDVPPDFIIQEIRLVMDDIGADAIKTGMLHTAGVIEAVADTLAGYKPVPMVVDPVMVAKGGAALMEPDALAALKSKLLPMAALATPNIPEAELLAGMPIRSTDDMKTAARRIAALGPKAVLLKGGHMEGATIHNVLLADGSEEIFSQPRIDSKDTHGTGCTLASAIATGMAQGLSLRDAVLRAQAYVASAIATAPGLGEGHGPLKHNFMIEV